MRTSVIERKTTETEINLSLNLDGTGDCYISTDCGFLNHMLTLFASHGRFDLKVNCKGDSDVDFHHTVEDIGIVLGQAFSKALADKKGIFRYGDNILPMDETLIMSSVDFSGRSFLGYLVDIPTQKVGEFDTELCEEFWMAFTRTSMCSLHIRQLSGKNSHHIIEGIFKSVARSLKQAVAIDEDFKNMIPSTKGVL